MERALRDACKQAGGQKALALALGLTSQGTVQGWLRAGRPPAERVLEIERVTGVPRYRLRPDIYPPSEYRRA
jgi:DNA-binding transcriptional regulator YdaS (Cro superfamily)